MLILTEEEWQDILEAVSDYDEELYDKLMRAGLVGDLEVRERFVT